MPPAPRTVLFCSQAATATGGVESWLDALCRELPRDRWRPVVALTRGLVNHDPDRFRAAHPQLDAVEIDGRGLAREDRVRAVMRTVRDVDPDLFVPLTVADAHDAAVRLKRDGSRPRYLLSVRGNDPQQVAGALDHAPAADLVACPGRLTCRIMVWGGAPLERVRHVPHGVRIPSDPERPERTGPLRLGYVGRLSDDDKRVRDLPELSDALVRRGVPFTLTVVGEGPDEAWLRNALEERLGRNTLHLPGPLPLRALHEEVYPALDVLLLFSPAESFGRVLVEGMAHGVVPVSSTFRGCGAEGLLVHEHTALLFRVGDAAGAAERVARLHEDRALLRELGRTGRRRVEQRYGLDRWLEGWLDAFDAAVELPARAAPAAGPERPAARGRFDRVGLPASVVHRLRIARRTAFGVPDAMRGGEEWPWIYREHPPSRIREIENAFERLDRPEAGAP